jgi:hypothetical protein
MGENFGQYAWAMSFVTWLVIYYLGQYLIPIPARFRSQLKPKDMMIIRHRLVCSLHGTICMFLGILWYTTQFDFTCGKPNTILETLIGANTSGHLAADFVFMGVNGFLDIGNLIHHILVGGAYSLPCFTKSNGSILGFMILPGEGSNVQMNMREVIRKVGWRFTKTYYHCEF